MPDRIFSDRRLAGVYDPLDPDRSDLDARRARGELVFVAQRPLTPGQHGRVV
jgi:hypothetical protein